MKYLSYNEVEEEYPDPEKGVYFKFKASHDYVHLVWSEGIGLVQDCPVLN